MFEGVQINEIANIIILVGAVIVATKNIIAFFKKPVDDIKGKALTDEEVRIKEVLKREIPSLMEENCNVIVGGIDELKQITLNQGETLSNIQDSIELMNQSQLDIMRYNMNKIYYKYRQYKKILSADKKAFIKIYNDYKPMGGNNWIDALYDELILWEIVEDESELKT